MGKFTIDADLLGILNYICRRAGPTIGLDGGAHMIREIHEQLDPKHVEDHIVTIAFECLGYTKKLTLCAWIAGAASLTPTFRQELYESGWLYGGTLPARVIKELKFCNKYIYKGRWE